ncbi:MAG: hypothetical protein ACPKOI_11820 [Pleomorphochaeta sp.]
MKKMFYFFTIFYLLLFFFTACDTKIIKSYNLLTSIDSTPPKLKYIESNSPYSVEIVFDEILSSKENIKISFNNTDVDNFVIKNNKITYYRKDKLIPGEKYLIKIKAEDLNGNSTFINSYVYTKNNNRANLLISEVSTKGTSANCDKVELVVTKSGSLAGIVVSDGFNDNYNDRYIFPDIYVNEGEFIVIAFKETQESDVFISENKNGLSSNNGCILILEDPSFNSPVIDCLIYSNKISPNCEGFASEDVLNTAKTLASIGLWENIFPLSQAAVDTTFETSTRTINRKFKNFYFIDTDSCEDFYTTVTRGDTFGYENNKEEYIN